ncbi:MAG: TauD/TfdA family dioxygenase [Crocinitomix sp.]|nr:TauD/TfdA family dioxygenase [Crocinitomix sp.]
MKNRLSKLMSTKAQTVSTAEKVETSVMSEELGFPFVIKGNTKGLILSHWIEENKTMFEDKITKHGGILFRNFDINTVEKFQELMKTFVEKPLEYNQRSSPRYAVGNNVYVTTTYPADRSINMHSESSYSPSHPGHIVFCCIIPAATQGETPIADNKKVLNLLSAETRNKFLEKGVRYVRRINDKIGLSWQEVFQTKERSVVEADCVKGGMSFEWKTEEELILTWNKKAIWNHPKTNEEIWFNHAFFFNKYTQDEDVLNSMESEEELPFNTYYGDGEQISKEEIAELRAAYKKATLKFLWESGDILFLDNMRISHGRSPYTGDRKVIVSLY